MKGMTFKEGQSPILATGDATSKIGKAADRIAGNIKDSVGNLITNIKNAPENIAQNIKNIGSGEEGEESGGGGSTVSVDTPDIDTSVSAEGTIVTPDDELIDITRIAPTTPTASPMAKRSPAKIYKTSAKGSQKKYKK